MSAPTRYAAAVVFAEPGVCVTCAGGACGALNQCISCLQECPVSSTPTVAEINAAVERAERAWAAEAAFYEAEEARWAEAREMARGYAEEASLFAARMTGQPYAYEAWDADAAYVNRRSGRAENWGVPRRVAVAMTVTQGRVA